MAGAPTSSAEQLIDLLGKMARSPRASWFGLSVEVRKLPRVMVAEAGENVAVIAASARNLALQMDRCIPENETEFRGVAQALANILANELVANGGAQRPHWARSDR